MAEGKQQTPPQTKPAEGNGLMSFHGLSFYTAMNPVSPLLSVIGFISLIGVQAAFGAPPEPKTVVLENVEGKKIEGILVGKDAESVEVKVKSKAFTIPLSKLSEESLAIVKATPLPMICDFTIKVEISRNSKTHKSSSTRRVGNSMVESKSSYRSNRIAGDVSVTNRDTKHTSPEAEIYVSVLTTGDRGIQVIQRDRFALEPIKPLGDLNFVLSESVVVNSPRGDDVQLSGQYQSRYYGYIAAVVVKGRVVEIDSSHANYKEDAKEAFRLLYIGKTNEEIRHSLQWR